MICRTATWTPVLSLLSRISLLLPGLLQVSSETTSTLDAHNGSTIKRKGTTPEDPFDVLIVGAGWAGISAGRHLIDRDVTTNFMVLEARDYVGGRTRTLDGYFGNDVPIEAGSTWIYPGSVVDDLMEDQFGIATTISDFSLDAIGIYDSSGRISPEEEQVLIEDYYRTRFAPFAKSMANNEIAVSEIKQEFFIQQEQTQQDQQLGNEYRQTVNAMVNEQVIVEYGADLSNANSESTFYYLGRFGGTIDYVGIPGGGYGRGVQELASDFSEDKIQLNTEVVKIDYSLNEDDVIHITTLAIATNTAASASDNNTTTSTTRRAPTPAKRAPISYYTKSVIVTVPLGTLQSQDIEFDPPLPPSKVDAIHSIGMGNLNKCIMYWDHENDHETIESWWPTRDQVSLQLITDQDENSNDWTYFFNDQSQEGNEDSYVMTSWIGGTAADRMELLSDQETIEMVHKNLQIMFAPKVIPKPTHYLITRWRNDTYSKGSYSYDLASSATSAAESSPSDNVSPAFFRVGLAKPIGNNRIFFAGEATVTDGWHGTTLGAYESGVRAVNQIRSMNLFNHGSSKTTKDDSSSGSRNVPFDVMVKVSVAVFLVAVVMMPA